jgi:glucose dehydrogenase
MQRRLPTFLILLFAAACSGNGGSSATNSAALLQAGTNGADWLIPGKSYSGNRLTTLTQIDPSNVGTLKESVGNRG